MRMRRIFVVAAATACALVIGPRAATAGYWSWLEQFSGPGPLKGWTVLSTFCVQEDFQGNKPGSRLLPSPISRSDSYHSRQWKQAMALNDEKEDATTTALYKSLLDNPNFEALYSFFGGVDASLKSLRAESLTKFFSSLANFPNGAPQAELLTQALKALADVAASPAQATATSGSDFVKGLYLQPQASIGPRHRDKAMTCGYFDYGRFHSEVAVGGTDDRGFPNVTANMYDVGPSVRLHDGLDIGGGFGRISFTAKPPLEPELSLGRWTITPFRSVIRPLLMAVPEQHRHDWMGVISLYWKETYIVGKLTGADFGVSLEKPGAAYQVDGELVRSFGVIFDASAALPWLGRRLEKWGSNSSSGSRSIGGR